MDKIRSLFSKNSQPTDGKGSEKSKYHTNYKCVNRGMYEML